MAATTVVNSPYDTSGNGGRKIVRLANGWLIAGARASSTISTLYVYVSKDNGATWVELGYTSVEAGDFSLVSYGTNLVILFNYNNSGVSLFKFDCATWILGTHISHTTATRQNLDSGQTAINKVSIAINTDGTELHAAWSSKNNNYSNSFNIHYAKGTIDGSGNVAWVVEQVTTNNTTGQDYINPCIAVSTSGIPYVVSELTVNRRITIFKRGTGLPFTAASGWTGQHIKEAVSYIASYPALAVDVNGVMHVVWESTDAENSNQQIRYNKSTDGGLSWSSETKLTYDQYGQLKPVISTDNTGKVHVFWHGVDMAVVNNRYQIRRRVHDGSSWGVVTSLTNSITTDSVNPSVMEREKASLIGLIYRETQASSIKFDSITLNRPPTLTLTSPANNLSLSEGNTMAVQGSVTDTDANDPVTIYLQINNGTILAVDFKVSNGATAIPFAKTLTYKNKRIYSGTTDLVGVDLAENTDHTLKVWAEDNKQGKSTEVIRKFRIIWNRPPVIDGENKDLGSFMQPPTVKYSATDPEGNTFTFSEYLNGKQIKSFAGVAGQQYTVEISHDAWIRLDLDVQHQIKIVATDSAGISSERIYTFTRIETHIEFMLEYGNPDIKADFTLDGMPLRVLVTLERYLPERSSIESVKVCNNYLDDVPTWEDCTNAVKVNRGYLFTNKNKTAPQWAINLWVTINKGTARERVLLNGYGGAFD